MSEGLWSDMFHQSTKLLHLEEGAQSDGCDAPIAWPMAHFKSYPRFDQIALDRVPSSSGLSVEDAITNRRSRRDFTGEPISLGELSKILFYSTGITYRNRTWDDSRRAYPSAGAGYPLESYPVVLRVRNVDRGIYHHDVKRNTLELMRGGDFSSRIVQCTGQEWVRAASVVLVVSAVFGRTIAKYGDRGYRYVFLDAGHMVQNTYLVAVSMNLGCCTIGGFLDHEMDTMLELDGRDESVVYIAAIGRC